MQIIRKVKDDRSSFFFSSFHFISFRVSSRRNIRSSTLPISSTDKNFLFNQNSNLFHSTLNIPKLDKLPPPKPPRQPLIEMNEYKLNNVIAHSLQVKLKPDIDGRYGFNIKVCHYILFCE
jgi:hypothetical protein